MRAGWLVLGMTSVAIAAPVKLTMHRTVGENVHIANQGGAINWREDTTVSVELDGGSAVARVSGVRSEHNLWEDGRNTDEETRFSAAWKGTYKMGDQLVMSLQLDTGACTHTKTGETGLSCKSAPAKATVTCASSRVDVEDDAGKTHAVDAWQCTSDGLGESPPWLLGKQACLEQVGGRSTSLRFCKP